MNTIYFDNAATTRIDENVLKEMLPYLNENYGNASAIYSIGRKSKQAIEEAREKISRVFNCKNNEIYFTSGGSESNNTIIKGIAHKYNSKGNHIITSQIEHMSVIETCKDLENEGFEVTYIPVDKDGTIDIKKLKESIRKTTILISIMYANNEIGTIQPIREIGEIARENKIFFHTDAVQAAGSIKIDVQDMNIDSLSLSGHKFYGPKGIGALYVKQGIDFKKLILGGHQEKNKRAGTENIAGIVGTAKALEIANKSINDHNNRITMLRDYFEYNVMEKIDGIKINGNINNRLPGNSNISFKNIKGDSLLLNLDLKGICASSGSACQSGAIEASYVLKALHLPNELLNSSLRISIGKYNTKDEVDYLIRNLIEIINRLREV